MLNRISIGTVVGFVLAAMATWPGESARAGIVTDGLVIHYVGSDYNQGTGVWANSGSAGASANATAFSSDPVAIASAADLNNQPAVKFNGTTDLLNASYAPSLFSSNEATVFVVANVGTSSTYELLWSSGRADTYTSFGGQGYMGLFRADRVDDTPNSGMPVADHSSDLFETVSTTGGFGVLLNGAAKVSATGDFDAPGILNIGGNNDNNGFFSGEIAEVLIYNRVLSDSEMKSTAAVLAATYDLDVANLPEPASASILLAGGLLLLRRRRASLRDSR